MSAAPLQNTEAPASREFMTAAFPKQELHDALRREVRSRHRSGNYMHADILWRVRQGETVSCTRMKLLYAFLREDLIIRYINELEEWGFITDRRPVLELADVP